MSISSILAKVYSIITASESEIYKMAMTSKLQFFPDKDPTLSEIWAKHKNLAVNSSRDEASGAIYWGSSIWIMPEFKMALTKPAGKITNKDNKGIEPDQKIKLLESLKNELKGNLDLKALLSKSKDEIEREKVILATLKKNDDTQTPPLDQKKYEDWAKKKEISYKTDYSHLSADDRRAKYDELTDKIESRRKAMLNSMKEVIANREAALEKLNGIKDIGQNIDESFKNKVKHYILHFQDSSKIISELEKNIVVIKEENKKQVLKNKLSLSGLKDLVNQALTIAQKTDSEDKKTEEFLAYLESKLTGRIYHDLENKLDESESFRAFAALMEMTLRKSEDSYKDLPDSQKKDIDLDLSDTLPKVRQFTLSELKKLNNWLTSKSGSKDYSLTILKRELGSFFNDETLKMLETVVRTAGSLEEVHTRIAKFLEEYDKDKTSHKKDLLKAFNNYLVTDDPKSLGYSDIELEKKNEPDAAITKRREKDVPQRSDYLPGMGESKDETTSSLNDLINFYGEKHKIAFKHLFKDSKFEDSYYAKALNFFNDVRGLLHSQKKITEADIHEIILILSVLKTNLKKISGSSKTLNSYLASLIKAIRNKSVEDASLYEQSKSTSPLQRKKVDTSDIKDLTPDERDAYFEKATSSLSKHYKLLASLSEQDEKRGQELKSYMDKEMVKNHVNLEDLAEGVLGLSPKIKRKDTKNSSSIVVASYKNTILAKIDELISRTSEIHIRAELSDIKEVLKDIY